MSPTDTPIDLAFRLAYIGVPALGFLAGLAVFIWIARGGGGE